MRMPSHSELARRCPHQEFKFHLVQSIVGVPWDSGSSKDLPQRLTDGCEAQNKQVASFANPIISMAAPTVEMLEAILPFKMEDFEVQAKIYAQQETRPDHLEDFDSLRGPTPPQTDGQYAHDYKLSTWLDPRTNKFKATFRILPENYPVADGKKNTDLYVIKSAQIDKKGDWNRCGLGLRFLAAYYDAMRFTDSKDEPFEGVIADMLLQSTKDDGHGKMGGIAGDYCTHDRVRNLLNISNPPSQGYYITSDPYWFTDTYSEDYWLYHYVTAFRKRDMFKEGLPSVNLTNSMVVNSLATALQYLRSRFGNDKTVSAWLRSSEATQRIQSWVDEEEERLKAVKIKVRQIFAEKQKESLDYIFDSKRIQWLLQKDAKLVHEFRLNHKLQTTNDTTSPAEAAVTALQQNEAILAVREYIVSEYFKELFQNRELQLQQYRYPQSVFSRTNDIGHSGYGLNPLHVLVASDALFRWDNYDGWFVLKYMLNSVRLPGQRIKSHYSQQDQFKRFRQGFVVLHVVEPSVGLSRAELFGKRDIFVKLETTLKKALRAEDLERCVELAHIQLNKDATNPKDVFSVVQRKELAKQKELASDMDIYYALNSKEMKENLVNVAPGG